MVGAQNKQGRAADYGLEKDGIGINRPLTRCEGVLLGATQAL
jgi:hypothetical protein